MGVFDGKRPILYLLWFALSCLTRVAVASNGAQLNDKELNVLQKRFDSYYSNDTQISVQGITLGGWLVTEPYITPSLYHKAINMVSQYNSTYHNMSQIVDEYTLCQELGYDKAKDLLSEHFDTWITESDFKQIKDDGFNLVRIPIGYWAWKLDHEENLYVGNATYEDPYVGEGLQLHYLNRALEWASKYELNVWIDLHGAPGSQNGFDNSGQRNFYNKLGWLSDMDTKVLTLNVWGAMFDEYLNGGNSSNPIVGIEVMNEPLVPKLNIWDVTQVYYEGFDMFKEKQRKGDNTTFIIHDAFQSIGHWNMELNPHFKNVSNRHFNLTNVSYSAQSVLVDHHHYEVFTDSQLQESQFSRIMNIINFGDSINKELQYHPAVVGEWSGAITDCATWVNGVNIGARYDGSYYNTTAFETSQPPSGNCTSNQPIDQWSDEYKIAVRQFVEAQLATYSAKTTGWIFWNWKTENAPEWDYLQLKEAGLFPVPFDNYTYFSTDGSGSIDSDFSSSLSTLAYPTSSGSRTTSSTAAKKGVASSFRKINLQDTELRALSGYWKMVLYLFPVCISLVVVLL
ncbi:glucan exo-1,3-beta-glucosidase KNAG_0B03180 [Huiozyma naganishii CBS 8797]|uniref:Glycoside hydrolase family 5 domain-containing protein n=1 Tax=Huiozyma naganishii (strain ATCC MYA-139 / BCRC 22969 / CBS 8797 / KCTC 17520 / NBRC 10181 / NCYC 3082 / Yp74L-3) TaxID=1071383 RepID=J7S3J3_HUIN7|nr:hypothetical protein KNAG_0B03180 [Kazachstania naganishii CBS 8797]CCK68759.1 hypothetical protein KNAG_0B03180 [Kazachstania naganishii CBS 8797]